MVKLIWLWKNQVLLIFQMLLSSLGELSFHLLLDMNQLKKILNFISILLMMNFSKFPIIPKNRMIMDGLIFQVNLVFGLFFIKAKYISWMQEGELLLRLLMSLV
jgi:hypothetical protein